MLPHAEDNEKHFLCCGLISEWGRKGILERGNVWSIILALWNVSSGFVFSCQAWLESGMGRKERDWGRAFCCKGKHRFDIFYTISKIKSLGVNTNLQSLIDIQNLWFSVKFVVELKDFFLAGLEVGVKLLVKVFTRWSGLLASPAPGTSTAASAGWGSTAPVGCTTTEGFVDATASAKKKIIVFK